MAKNAQSIEERRVVPKAPKGSLPPRKMSPKSLANLTPYKWQPGQSGNPKGGRKSDAARELCRKLIENNSEQFYAALGKAILKGNAYAFSVIADRGYGKLTQKNELTGKNGGPIETREIEDGELSERIAQLEHDLGLAREIDDAGRAGIAQAGEATPSESHEAAHVLPSNGAAKA